MRTRIEFPIEQFNVIFQVIKEFDNVAWEQTPDLGSRESLDQALRTARDVNRAARRSAASRVVFIDPGAPVKQQEEIHPRVEQEDGATVIHASAAAAHLPLWAPIVIFVIENLGEREIFLRTGHRSDEINSAMAYLDEKVKRFNG